MKGNGKLIIGAAMAIALAGSAIAAAGWVLSTAQGTHWFLTSALPLSGVSFSAAKIEGRLLDRLLLTQVRVGLAQRKVELDRLELRWNPLLLPTGRFAIRELRLKGVRIQDDTPFDGKAPLPAWPGAGSARFVSGKIERLRVTDLSYRRLRREPVLAAHIGASVTWRNNLLTLSDLKVDSPSGRLHGSVSAGFDRPSLTADLAISPAHPLARMDRFSLQVRPGGGALGRFVGRVALSGGAGTRKLLELSGDVAMGRKTFDLRKLRLTGPGRQGLIGADGSLDLSGAEPVVSLQVRATGLDLAPELKLPTDLSGTLRFAGRPDSYRGDLTLANAAKGAKGWQATVISAPYQGTRAGMKLAPLTGSIMGGSLSGNLDLDWRQGMALRGAISGRNLNPALVAREWKGVANFTAAGQAAWSGQTPPTGRISGALLESRLHGEALTGELQAEFAGGDLFVSRLALVGQGFDVRASGRLKQRLAVTAQIGDFSRLVPGSAGTLRASGWVRRSAGKPSGALAGTGSRLAYAGARIADADLTLRLDEGEGYPLHLAASLRDVTYRRYAADAVTLAADGTLARHTVNAALGSDAAGARLKLSAGYRSGIWKGELASLAGRDGNGPWQLTAPAAFAVGQGKFTLAPLSITAGASERLDLGADLALYPLSGRLHAQWSGLNLARANPYLKDMQITGSSRGSVRLGLVGEKRLTLAGSAAGQGTFTSQSHSIAVRQGLATVDGGEQGLRVALELAMTDGGTLKGSFATRAPLGPALPERGELKAEAAGVDLAPLKPWLPSGTGLEGRLSGRSSGHLLPGGRFDLSGDASLSGGALHRESPDGVVQLAFAAATASWVWRDQALDGTLSLTLAENGKARAKFQLPLAARFPVALDRKGPLRASLTGQVQEKGFVAALLAGLVRETSGELEADVDVAGTWEAPRIGGTLRLTKAGAYLPAAGIRLKQMRAAARLENNLVRIESFRAVSGAGHIEGTALLTLDGWRLSGYRGTIRGEDFQTIHLPDLGMLGTPDLTFEGSPQKLTLRGELRVPELRIASVRSRAVIAPSGDVVREGKAAPATSASTLALDLQLRVLLGERVYVKVAGIDAQLDGAVQISMSSPERITGTGQIRVVKGHYRTYGVDLDIVRGRLLFAGGPVDRAALDLLALRTIGEVRAGVQMSGTVRKRVTKLYSEPAMPDADVLSYIVLGHSIGGSGESAGLMAQAAGALLSSGQSAVLQDQIKTRLGLSTLEVQGGVGATSGFMGYKPLQVTPPGAVPAEQQPGMTETVLTVGKHLTPKFYVSYGKSLYTGSNLFKMRYDIFKQWQIETLTGSESGADLYYKLEFK